MSTMMEYQQKFGLFNPPPSLAPEKVSSDKTRPFHLATGFSCYYNNDFDETTDQGSQADQARALTLSKTVPRITSGLYYSTNATVLLNMFTTNNATMRDFEFREQVFYDLKRNLGFTSLRPLLEAQINNDYLSPSHVAYLEETLDLLHGYTDRRRVSNETWSALLYHNVSDFVNARKDMKILMNKSKYSGVGAPIEEILVHWMATVPGITDVVWFNNLIWGRPLSGQIQ